MYSCSSPTRTSIGIGDVDTINHLDVIKLWSHGRLLQGRLSLQTQPTPPVICSYMMNVFVTIQWRLPNRSIFTGQWHLCIFFRSNKLLSTSVRRVIYLLITIRIKAGQLRSPQMGTFLTPCKGTSASRNEYFAYIKFNPDDPSHSFSSRWTRQLSTTSEDSNFYDSQWDTSRSQSSASENRHTSKPFPSKFASHPGEDSAILCSDMALG